MASKRATRKIEREAVELAYHFVASAQDGSMFQDTGDDMTDVEKGCFLSDAFTDALIDNWGMDRARELRAGDPGRIVLNCVHSEFFRDGIHWDVEGEL